MVRFRRDSSERRHAEWSKTADGQDAAAARAKAAARAARKRAKASKRRNR